LKSALFGTPALPDETVLEVDKQPDVKRLSIPIHTNTRRDNLELDETLESMSPTKRGILMTPGTATTRRKSVSFGSEALEKKEGVVGCKALTKKRDDTPYASKSKDIEFGDGSGDESPSKQRSARRDRSASLTKSLEDARERKSSQSENARFPNSKRSKKDRTVVDSAVPVSLPKLSSYEEHVPGSYDETMQDLTQVLDFTNNSSGQMTVDLDKPQSKSGKFWKSQYKTYHEEALAEMAHLLRYKDLAKSYARKKDEEATELADKLKLEQMKVIQMENMITKLSSKHANPKFGDAEDSLEDIQEVAKLKALVVQYKAQVEEFRVELEELNGRQKSSKNSVTSSNFDEKSMEQSAIQEELSKARKSLLAAEKKSRRLEVENVRLTQELNASDLHLVKQRERNQKMQQSCQDEVRRKEEALVNLRREYNELMDLKRDSEELLRKRQDQVTALKQEILTLKGANTTAQSLYDGVRRDKREHEEIIAGLRSQLGKANTNGQRAGVEEKTIRDRQPFRAKSPSYAEATHTRESLIPLSVQSNLHSKELAATRSDPTLSHSPQRPLSEIVNSASVDKLEPRSFSDVRYSPMATHFSDLSIGDLTSGLPPVEPSYAQNSSRRIHEKTCRASPRPSMFNIPSSPPKYITPGLRSSGDVARQKSNPDLNRPRPLSMAQSRLPTAESPRVRKDVPPERVAAAKARLEQKAADKRKLQATYVQKEISRI
jgi:hypothetical protein